MMGKVARSRGEGQLGEKFKSSPVEGTKEQGSVGLMGPCSLAPRSRLDPMEFATSETANLLAARSAAVGLKSLLRYQRTRGP